MTTGFGPFDITCPGHKQHAWQPHETPNRCCVNCGVVAAEFLIQSTHARYELFATLKFPASANGTPRRKP